MARRSDATTFFCRACLEDVPLKEISKKDIRYCDFCQPIIENEYQMVADRKERPLSHFYKPILPPDGVPPNKPQGQIMLPTEVAENHRYRNSRLSRKRGPKMKPLPEEKIRELSSKGLGVKAIAHQLKAKGIEVSAQTISRLIRGERQEAVLLIP